MISQFAVFAFGLALLWVGAELLIKNASRLASSLGVSPIIIGLSIVSLGTSAPELVVSIVAVIEKNSGISIGNIVGSNMANIGLILGIGALMYPMEIKKSWIHREVPYMILTTIVFMVLAYLGTELNFVDGFILLAMMIAFLFYLGHFSAKEMNAFRELNSNIPSANHNKVSAGKKLIFLLLAIIGAGVLIFGSELTVSSGKEIALNYGVSDLVIGLTLVAVGTSLPELATTIVAAVKKETDIIVGNIIGSNIFNLLLIGGIVPIIEDIEIDMVLFKQQFPILFLLSLLVWPLMRLQFNVKRVEGLLLVLIYFTFIYITF